MSFLDILVLAIVQGVAELLPVSSSAHVVMAEKLLGLDPAAPQMTFLLVMLHTGTMFAVIGYFWRSWRQRFFPSMPVFIETVKQVAAATIATGLLGYALILLIEKVFLQGSHDAQGSQGMQKAEIEQLFGNTYVIASGLAAAAVFILVSGLRAMPNGLLTLRRSVWIGAVQGLCLPFRGFSRSGATISTGLLIGVERIRAEEFSFALAVVLTPPVIVREGYRLLKHQSQVPEGVHELAALVGPGLVGMVFSFIAGWIALRWLSKWLEHGRWYLFGIYCLIASAVVLTYGRG